MPASWTIAYGEQNSGGRWRVPDEGWGRLRSRGWAVHMPSHTATKRFDSPSEDEAFRSAASEWEAATGLDVTDPGCDCCGPPHSFWVDEVHEEAQDHKAALKDMNMDGRTECACCGGSLREPYPGIRHCPACE